MNNTTGLQAYGVVGTALMPIAPAIVCPIISLMTYLLARRSLTAQTESSSRTYVFYRLTSGNLFGIFVSRMVFLCSFWVAAFCAIGFTLFNISESIAFIWNTNENYVAVGDETRHEDVGLDRTKMVHKDVYMVDDVGGEQCQETLMTIEDIWKIETKRIWIFGCLFVIFTIMSITDGLLLIYKAPESYTEVIASVISYYFTCSSLSSCIYATMIHGRIYSISSDKRRVFMWIIITATWCIVLVCNLIPLFIGMDYETAKYIVEYPALTAFFGASLGVMLKICVYFHSLRTTSIITRENRIWGEVVFGFSVAQSIATGFFL
jgi:hypothetical protein